jgi:putative transposase
MQEMGLIAVYPGPNLSKRHSAHRVFPYLLRDITPAVPDQVWGTDITYIRLRHGWMYLVAVLDWYSRYIVSWAFSDTLEIGFVLDAARQALARATPQIWNTDQGSHFTSPQFTELVLASGARLSMDGKGRALDNIFTERLWRTIKYDHVFLHDWATPCEARQSLGSLSTPITSGGSTSPWAIARQRRSTSPELPPSSPARPHSPAGAGASAYHAAPGRCARARAGPPEGRRCAHLPMVAPAGPGSGVVRPACPHRLRHRSHSSSVLSSVL